MINKTLLALSALACVLAGVIVFEATGVADDAALPPAVAAAAMSPRLAGAPAATADDTVATILARPLFAPGRRPAALDSAAPENLPRLSGVIISPAGRAVVFIAGNGHSMVVEQGGRVGLYVLTAISANSVTVAGPDGLRELHTAFASGSAPGPADQTFAAVVAPETMPDWLRNAAPDLPVATGWNGPPGLSALPEKSRGPASAPLLSAPH